MTAHLTQVGAISGAPVYVSYHNGQQTILIELPVHLLKLIKSSIDALSTDREDGDLVLLAIPHDEVVDQALIELIDTATAIRYAHPSLVQLTLFQEDEP